MNFLNVRKWDLMIYFQPLWVKHFYHYSIPDSWWRDILWTLLISFQLMITLKITSPQRVLKIRFLQNELRKFLIGSTISFLLEMNSEIIARSVTDFLFISDGCLSFKTNFVTQKKLKEKQKMRMTQIFPRVSSSSCSIFSNKPGQILRKWLCCFVLILVVKWAWLTAAADQTLFEHHAFFAHFFT